MKVLVNCGKVNKRDVLIIQDGKTTKYITCNDYTPTDPEGQQWRCGEYRHDVISFAKLILEEIDGIYYDRFKEIAEKAMCYLNDNNLLDEFLEDQDIDLTYREEDYFFPDDEEEWCDD